MVVVTGKVDWQQQPVKFSFISSLLMVAVQIERNVATFLCNPITRAIGSRKKS